MMSMSVPGVEYVRAGDRLIAVIVSRGYEPPSTQFVTSSEANLQLGFIRYPAGGVIQEHVHRPIERHIVGTNEVLLVRQGKMEVFLYGEDRRLVAQRVLGAGDLLLLVGGGHGFRMLEDTVMVEVKQGPYTGIDEKERFLP